MIRTDLYLNFAAGPGEGPAIVFVHGLLMRWQDWSATMAGFAGRWRTIAVDLRGHGKSGRSDCYRVVDYVGDVREYLRSLGQPVVLVGHSLGALVALGVAADEPTAVRALVLEDPPSVTYLASLESTPVPRFWRALQKLAGPGRPVAEVTRELAGLGLPLDAVSLRLLARSIADFDPAAMTPALENRQLDGFDVLVAASRVQCPTLLMVGDATLDGMLPDADATALAAAIPDATRLDFPGVGHSIHASNPSRFAAMVLKFLDSL